METLKPPPSFTKKGDLLIPKHHSVSDWDMQFGAPKTSLSTTRYVSAPSSLRVLEPTGDHYLDVVLCRVAETLCLPQGEVRNWVWHKIIAVHTACFRNQAVLGTADRLNCYYVHLSGEIVRLYRIVGGTPSLRDQTTYQPFYETWTHLRVLFWNGLTPELVEALCVNLYREVAGDWEKEGETMYDTDNYWKDSEINRVGFIPYSTGNLEEYWDDTEIWGPA